MSTPIWVDCNTIDDVAEPSHLASLASEGSHVVLRFPSVHPNDVSTLIHRLSSCLTGFSVFRSSPAFAPATVTIMPVVAENDVIDRMPAISVAVNEYRKTCAELIQQYNEGTLSECWRTDEHGEHCRFENAKSGQIVEAPFENHFDVVDPYFFALYVGSTPQHRAVAELIQDTYHDAAKILDTFQHGTEQLREPEPPSGSN